MRVGRVTAKATLPRTTARCCDSGWLARRGIDPTEVGRVVPSAGHSTVVGEGVKAYGRALRPDQQAIDPRRAEKRQPESTRRRSAAQPRWAVHEPSRPISPQTGPCSRWALGARGSRGPSISTPRRRIGSRLATRGWLHEPCRPPELPPCLVSLFATRRSASSCARRMWKRWRAGDRAACIRTQSGCPAGDSGRPVD
jgi:hypothetical protein